MPQRPFYIIGHNPNTVQEAAAFLHPGGGYAANALEPDIIFNAAEGEYYLFHPPLLVNWNIPSAADEESISLYEYLNGLEQMIGHVNLALIVFDIKEAHDTGFDINHFMQFVYGNFSSKPHCSHVAILATVADYADINVMSAFNNQYGTFGVGIDEHGDPGEVQSAFKEADVANFTYAHGSSLSITKAMKNSVKKAGKMQSAGNSFKLVYAWTVNSEKNMKTYLDMGVDGMIVDLAAVASLSALLSDLEYRDRYRLAEPGYNPFAQ